jgi:hypothetical protein
MGHGAWGIGILDFGFERLTLGGNLPTTPVARVRAPASLTDFGFWI